ncbi:AAA family ATPase [Montanilutibacter psychrotolerans]|uniref:AAA family ATPase n=1 Tax=Montanilutibacter psychrotolerans TaxID=1327343 RepID=UPI001CC1CE43|nr:hypothetical protein [Lysobacter psychrotolerans]
MRARDGRSWRVVSEHLATFDSIFGQIADPRGAPEVLMLRETIRGWRFYDHFRSDTDAPARLPQLGTRTPVLSHDGRDLAAAWQTIVEIGDPQALHEAVVDAFPGAQVDVVGRLLRSNSTRTATRSTSRNISARHRSPARACSTHPRGTGLCDEARGACPGYDEVCAWNRPIEQ